MYEERTSLGLRLNVKSSVQVGKEENKRIVNEKPTRNIYMSMKETTSLILFFDFESRLQKTNLRVARQHYKHDEAKRL